MKKKIVLLLLPLMVLAACGSSSSTSSTSSSSASASSSSSTSTSSSSTQPEEREVQTYIDWDFDDLDIGDEIPNTASEGAGFAAFRKDASDDVWVRSKNPRDWAAVYFGTPDPIEGGEIFLKDFAVISELMLPSSTAADGLSNDGGFPLLVGPVGRYDAAVYFGEENSSFNLWHAGNTDGGPIATTQHNATWGDRGSKAEILNLYKDVVYTMTVAGKYEGMTEEGDEFFTLFVFVNDRLIVQKEHIAYWTGGFGLRGWQSAIEYTSIKVTDFPLLCPDGINHYDGDEGGDYEPTPLAAPVVTLNEKVLSWAAVDHAAKYGVFNNVTLLETVDGLSFDAESLPAGEYSLAVKAFSNQNLYIHSELSNHVSVTIAGEPEVINYLNWNFADLSVDADMPFVANDGPGFKVVEHDAEKWVQSKQKAGWSAVFFGVSDGSQEVFPTNASYKVKMYNPNEESAEGGLCMMVGASGRYDIGVYMNGGSSSINVWEAGNTDNGPVATTQHVEAWGDRGSKVPSLTLNNKTAVNLEVIYKESSTEQNKFTIYVFVNSVLVIEKAGLNAKTGGFGLRSLNGEVNYTDMVITSAPSKGPDNVTIIV